MAVHLSETLALHAITERGSQLLYKLQGLLSEQRIEHQGFSLYPVAKAAGMQQGFKAHIQQHFAQYSVHICFCSVGIMMRLLAPLLQDKRQDPAIICIDEQGQFVIPILSGHRGGANQWAMRLATLLGGQAVLTTASDASHTLSVDLLGAGLGWHLDPSCEPEITTVSAAVVNQQAVYLQQDSGSRQWWPHHRALPENIHTTEFSGISAQIFISHRTDLNTDKPSVIWRPTVLHLGIGCDRNTPLSVLQAALEAFLKQHQLSALSIASLNSLDLKADEAGLLALAAQMRLPFQCYSAADLEGVKGIENPSATVMRCVGVTSVAEATSLKAAKATQLLAPKFKFKAEGFNVTLAASLAAEANSQARQHKGKGMRPFYYHLILCGGRHCHPEDSQALASKLRRLAGTELSLEKKLKITRSNCLGACRQGIRAMLYCREQQSDVNHGLGLKNLEHLGFDGWRQLFAALENETPVTDVLQRQFIGESACSTVITEQ